MLPRHHRHLAVACLLLVGLLGTSAGRPKPPVTPLPIPGSLPIAGSKPMPPTKTLVEDVMGDFQIMEDTVVPSERKVTVKAGVILSLAWDVNLTVNGHLTLAGTPGEGIIQVVAEMKSTKPKKPAMGAGRIIIANGGRLTLVNVRLQNLGSGRAGGAIELAGKGGELELTAVEFSNIFGNAVVGRRGRIPKISGVSFKEVQGNGLELYGDHMGDIFVHRSTFVDCKGYGVFTYRYQGRLTVDSCSFTGGGRYAVFIDGDVEFHVDSNTFSSNQGAFACRRHEMEARGPNAQTPTLANNTMTDNQVDLESDVWSQGNLIYLHWCEVQMAGNTILRTSKRGVPPKESKKLPNLINFFDSTVEMRRNVIVNNSHFLFTMNVGGTQTKLKMERNLLSNPVEGVQNYEIANEASGVRVAATKNWWGCDTEECVKGRILDFTVGGEKYGVVEHLPILTKPDIDQEVVESAPEDDESSYYDFDSYFERESKSIIEKAVTWTADTTVKESLWIKKDGLLIIRSDEDSYNPDNLTIWLRPGVNIHVDGALQVIGTGTRFVRFAPDPEEDESVKPWGCITFSKSAKSSSDPVSPSSIQYAEFFGGGAQPSAKDGPQKSGASGMVILSGPNITVQNSVFTASAGSGLVVAKGQVQVDRCQFIGNEGNALVSHSTEPLGVTKSLFSQNKKFAILLTHGTYNITDTVFRDGNVGVLCVRRRRNEDPTKVVLEKAALPASEFLRNTVAGNKYAPGQDCWGDTGEDTMVLLTLAAKPVRLSENTLKDNKCDPKAVRRRATIFFLTADDAILMTANIVERNYGKIYIARPRVAVESWEHPPPAFFLEGNVFASNLFFSIMLNVPGRRAFVVDNVLQGNEVSDESALKAQPLLDVLGGEFTRRPMTLNNNHLLGNEGTLLAVRLHDLAVASGNWFSNPFIKYELEFANPDPMGFTGTGNYWGDFGPGDAAEVAQRIKPSAGKVPKRWYHNWITSDGRTAEVQAPPKDTVRDVDKASATLTFLVVVVLGFLIVVVVVVALYCRGAGHYAMLDLDDEKPAAE